MITCSQCGAGTPAGKFCAQCGAPLQTPGFSRPPVGRRPPGLMIGLAAGGLAVLALLGWGIYALAEGSTPSSSQSSQPAAQAPAGNKSTARPGWVAGTVTDGSGNPLKLSRDQVVLRVTGDLKDGQAYQGTYKPDANWRYAVEVPPGSYAVGGFVKVNFEGKEFWLSLDPVGGTTPQDSAKGVVKDLRWKLSGLKPNSDRANPYSYYGSYVEMRYQGRTLPDAAKVTFTVTPLTPLADGSQGQPLTFEATGQELRISKKLMDIPLARYRITGEVTLPDGSRKKAQISGASGPATAAQEFTFTPNSMGEGLEGVSLWMMGES